MVFITEAEKVSKLKSIFKQYRPSLKRTRTILIQLAGQIILTIMLLHSYGFEVTMFAILPQLLELLQIIEKKEE